MERLLSDRIKRMIRMKKIVFYLRRRESMASMASDLLAPDTPSPLHYGLRGVDRNSFVAWVLKQEKYNKKPLTKDQVEYAINDGLSDDFKYIETGADDTFIRT